MSLAGNLLRQSVHTYSFIVAVSAISADARRLLAAAVILYSLPIYITRDVIDAAAAAAAAAAVN